MGSGVVAQGDTLQLMSMYLIPLLPQRIDMSMSRADGFIENGGLLSGVSALSIVACWRDMQHKHCIYCSEQ